MNGVRRAAFLACLLLACIWVRPLGAGELLPFPLGANQRGTVTCLENPAISYDIYLPPGYSTNGTPLPILYTLNPSGGGLVSSFYFNGYTMNFILVGLTGVKNDVPWPRVFREFYAVTRDIRQRVLYDPTAEFVGGFSGGALCSYMFSRMRAQHVAGVLAMGGWLGRGNFFNSVSYYGIDRLQTNLLVARATGTTDAAANFYLPYDSNYLATCSATVMDWSFTGGHQVPPGYVFQPILTWLHDQRVPPGPEDRTNAYQLGTNWQARLALGEYEPVLRECVSNLLSFPRSWFAHEAQLTLDQLLTNSAAVRSLNVDQLAQGDFAADLFFYHAYGAATNAQWSRYDSCMKALTGITITNNYVGTTSLSWGPFESQSSIFITTSNYDHAGDVYFLLTNYHHYLPPQLQIAPNAGSGDMQLYVAKDTPGLGYSLESRSNLMAAPWQVEPAMTLESNLFWSATSSPFAATDSGFFRVQVTPLPAISPRWPLN